jgi:hypothetical protein
MTNALKRHQKRELLGHYLNVMTKKNCVYINAKAAKIAVKKITIGAQSKPYVLVMIIWYALGNYQNASKAVYSNLIIQ